MSNIKNINRTIQKTLIQGMPSDVLGEMKRGFYKLFIMLVENKEMTDITPLYLSSDKGEKTNIEIENGSVISATKSKANVYTMGKIVSEDALSTFWINQRFLLDNVANGELKSEHITLVEVTDLTQALTKGSKVATVNTNVQYGYVMADCERTPEGVFTFYGFKEPKPFSFTYENVVYNSVDDVEAKIQALYADKKGKEAVELETAFSKATV